MTACHASCVVLGEDGVLVRGASGSGKSRLCLSLIQSYRTMHRHARLVGDDRIVLSARNGRLVARPHPSLAGWIEIRGAGLHRLDATADAAIVRLVVDLVDTMPRLPDHGGGEVMVTGLRLPVLHLEPRQPHEYLIRTALIALQRRRLESGGVSRQTHPDVLLSFGATDP